jgi:hypothetical protein
MNVKEAMIINLDACIESSQKTIDKFKADLEKNGITHTLRWMVGDVMLAEKRIELFKELRDWMSSSDFSFNELKRQYKREVYNLLGQRPWESGGNGLIENLDKQAETSARASFINKLEEIIAALENTTEYGAGK